MRWALLNCVAQVSPADVDLVFVDIAKNSKRLQGLDLRNVPPHKMKIGWADFLDCLCELAHMRFPGLQLRERALQQLVQNLHCTNHKAPSRGIHGGRFVSDKVTYVT